MLWAKESLRWCGVRIADMESIFKFRFGKIVT